MVGNLKLLVAIRRRGLRQGEFAKLVGDSASLISRVINGRENLDEERKLRYARTLKCHPEELFGVEGEK